MKSNALANLVPAMRFICPVADVDCLHTSSAAFSFLLDFLEIATYLCFVDFKSSRHHCHLLFTRTLVNIGQAALSVYNRRIQFNSFGKLCYDGNDNDDDLSTCNSSCSLADLTVGPKTSCPNFNASSGLLMPICQNSDPTSYIESLEFLNREKDLGLILPRFPAMHPFKIND